MGLGLGQHTRDVIPQASFAFDYAPTESLAVGALAVLPLRKAVVKSGATTQVGTTRTIASTSPFTIAEVFETDPNTASAWTISGINAVETGFRLIA